jgi:tetratricopeptide (TPR) repeat protein
VTDFGLARLQGDSDLTLSGDLLGTLRYMSPEQAAARRVVIDQRTDVYSLGVTLYELLALRPAFDGRDRAEILRRIAFEEPQPLRKLNASVPYDLETIIAKAMDKDPAGRYATAGELAADLRRFLEDHPIRARRPSVLDGVAKWARRHRALVVLGAVLLVLGTAVSTWQAVRARRAEQSALRAEVAARRERDRAVTAEGRASEAARKAQTEASISKAINEFLLKDLLAEAAPDKNARERPVTVGEALNEAAARIAGKFDGQPEVEAAIRYTVAATYRALGLYEEALPHAERALELRRRVLGPEHPDTLETMNLIRVLYLSRLSTSAQAEPLIKQLLEVQRRVLGPDHPDTLTTMHNVAPLYGGMGRYEKAETLYTQELEVQRRVLGPGHPDTLPTMSSLSLLYRDMGQHEKAEPLSKQALEVKRRVYGPDHPSTLTTMTQLGFLYVLRGQYEKAETLLKQALEVERRVLGLDHPDTVLAMERLVQITSEKTTASDDDRSRALEMARQAVKHAPKRHLSWKWLAWAECLAGNWDAAIQAAEKCIQLKGDQGWAHQWLVLAVAHARRGEMKQARAWYAKAARERNTEPWSDPMHKLFAEAEVLLGLAELPDDVFAPAVSGPTMTRVTTTATD